MRAGILFALGSLAVVSHAQIQEGETCTPGDRCAPGLVCQVVDPTTQDMTCQKNTTQTAKCNTMQCGPGQNCVDTATGAVCEPIILAEGDLCKDSTFNSVGDCMKGFVCEYVYATQDYKCQPNATQIMNCNTWQCDPGHNCVDTITGAVCEPIPLAEGDVCLNQNRSMGKCVQGLVCKMMDTTSGAQEYTCQSNATQTTNCNSWQCGPGHNCVDTASGAVCEPIVLVEGDVCKDSTFTSVGDCMKGLVCTMMDTTSGVQEYTCQSNATQTTNCNTLQCGPGHNCVDAVTGAVCEPNVLAEGDMCFDNGKFLGNCAKGMECKADAGTQVSSCQPVATTQLMEGDICMANGAPLGVCANDLVCQPVDMNVPRYTCQVPAMKTCANVRCESGHTCTEGANGPVCQPIVLKKGELCASDNGFLGRCEDGLECKADPAVQIFAPDAICQSAALTPVTCADKVCADNEKCVEEGTNVRCMPVDPVDPAEPLMEGEVCLMDGTAKCAERLVCKAFGTPAAGTTVQEYTCQKPTCADWACIATMRCVDDSATGARCEPIAVDPKPPAAHCMDAAGNKVTEGESYILDNCNTCTCSKGKIACTEKKCEDEYVKEGAVCDRMTNKCEEGLLCLPRDVQTFAAEFVCQKQSCKNTMCPPMTTCVMGEFPKCVDRPLDCTWTADTVAPWTSKQKEECCEKENIRCPPKVDEATQEKRDLLKEQCKAGTADATECCRMNIVCPADKARNCSGTIAKGEEEDKCCTDMNVCPIDCLATDLTPEQQGKCCGWKNLYCKVDRVKPAGKVFELKLLGAVEELMKNPMAFLKKFRMALLRGSPLLAKNPERLVVTAVGALMAGHQTPPKDKWSNWAFDIDRQANLDAAKEEKEILARYVRAATVQGAEGAAEAGAAEGVFGDWYVTEGDDDLASKAVEEVTASMKEAETGDGAMADSTDGYSLAVTPVAGGITEVDSGDDDSGDSNGWVYGLVAGLGALCMGSALALTVYYRKKNAEKVAFNEIDYVDANQMELRSI